MQDRVFRQEVASRAKDFPILRPEHALKLQLWHQQIESARQASLHHLVSRSVVESTIMWQCHFEGAKSLRQ